MAEFFVYENYPEGMTDSQIENYIREYTSSIYKSRANINHIWQVAPLIQLGQYELEKRQTKRITRLTIGISIISMLVAIVALTISILNTSNSTEWQKLQLELLENIEEEITRTIYHNNTAHNKTSRCCLLIGAYDCLHASA